ncbi:MAG: Ldh family oxidoreductase [Limnochordia bacterium]|jgi:LDH2 family malate/lactate/ureidoglycolate dehydrogenase|nr:Ldh family oxidoreductase [Bacillota bacterium]
METYLRVPMDELKTFGINCLMRARVPADEAEIISDNLVMADARGVYSHGMMRLGIYIDRVRKGGTAAKTRIEVVRSDGGTALIDGGNGSGHVISVRAMEMAIDKAGLHGIGAVGVRGSNHNGAEAYFAMQALQHDMIGFCVTVGGVNIMAPWGGRSPLLGNNPFAIAIPAGEELPIVLDMACSVAARGWIVLARKNNESIPPGWALNKEGEPTTDPTEAYEGTVLPVGGYKGFGLALIGAVLGGVLTGAAVGSEVTDFYEDLVKEQNVGHFFAALKVEHFLPIDQFKANMDNLIRELKSVELAKGFDRIYMPGEREFLNLEESRTLGVKVSLGVARELAALGRELGVAPPAAIG